MGWYISGTFTSVGGVPRSGLAHILSNGTLDSTWAPTLTNGGRAIAFDGASVYVGGNTGMTLNGPRATASAP